MTAANTPQRPLTILGIDPGSRFMGFGVIVKAGNRLTHVESGVIKVNLKDEIHQRLRTIHAGVVELLERHKPDHVAVEKMFFAKDAVAAMKLGQARGVTLLAIADKGSQFFEYSPNEVKMAVSGYGHADKEQVARLVSLVLGVKDFDRSDASDALAIAICHANTYTYIQRGLPASREKGLGA